MAYSLVTLLSPTPRTVGASAQCLENLDFPIGQEKVRELLLSALQEILKHKNTKMTCSFLETWAEI